jgi:translation initiation factor eIF-2B subunit gamma
LKLITLNNNSKFRFPRVRVHTDLQDAHLYIFKRWIIDMVVEKENITSISKDLIPLLVKCQYQKKLVEREEINKCKFCLIVKDFKV